MLTNIMITDAQLLGLPSGEFEAVMQLLALEPVIAFFEAQARAVLLSAMGDIDPMQHSPADYQRKMNEVHTTAKVWQELAIHARMMRKPKEE